MPTYEYKCIDCQHKFEKFQSINAENIKECPKCGKTVEKLISAGAGIIFKGSGFYSTDYKNNNTTETTKTNNTPTPNNKQCECKPS